MSVLGKLTFGALAAAGIYALAKRDGKGQKKQVQAAKPTKQAAPAKASEPTEVKPKVRKQRGKRRAKRAHAA